MNEQYIKLLIDLHKDNFRQGPGGKIETLKALSLAEIDKNRPLKVLDIGCGTGASTIELAKELNADITAVDLFPDFLNVLNIRAIKNGVADKITTFNGSMDALPFDKEEFDIIWSEGAIYNIGFASGVTNWSNYLKRNGKLIVSEITWLTNTRPDELHTFWHEAYPEIDLASAKIKILEQNNYSPISYFHLPPECWVKNYYTPLQNKFDDFLQKHPNNPTALEIVQQETKEIDLYMKYKDFYSYGFYIAKKI